MQHPSLIFMGFLIACGIWLGSYLATIAPALSQVAPPAATSDSLPEILPPLQAHPLPPTLAQWQPDSLEDYFTAVQPTDFGYLVWSNFPVKVYVEPVPQAATGYERDRAQAWVTAVTKAVQDWNIYLPLEIVSSSDADIQVQRRAPPLRSVHAANVLPRVRSAETRYQVFVDRSRDSSPRDSSNSENASALLSHRFTVYLSANQTAAYTEATARHELGHALGIWGHSPVQTDVLYFSQVRNSPPISHRDINTLKQIYQQPTRLGWSIE
ncbi:MAG: peptidase [Drouetiella hepatica Uher 2000/2452]|jgi:predicted Zn-dependent protease|uniref:Peptidase n=1 Tax=Drouetiella hepatica Uher 2000/2452 TaxID=904376 RepID=A0A951QF57_9CYAN|nr:peptidase [Drouetiella hepatica Uher 2000/2452]